MTSSALESTNSAMVKPSALGGAHVDEKFKLGRLLDREVAWISAFENLVHIGGGTPVQNSPRKAEARPT